MGVVRQAMRQRSAWIVLGLALASLTTTVFFAGRLYRPGEADRALVVLWFLATAAAVFRPRVESGLALGAAGFASAVFFYDPAIAALFSVSTFLAANFVHGWLVGTARERFGRWRRLLGSSASQLGAGLAAGWVAWSVGVVPVERLDGSFYGKASLVGIGYLVVLGAFEILQTLDAEGHIPWRGLGVGFLYEASAWSIGAVSVSVAVGIGAGTGWFLLAALTCVALVLLRRDKLHRAVAAQAKRLRELQLAGHRIIFGETDMLSMARQIFAECRRVVPFSWFHFQLSGDGGWQEGWWAGPEGMVRPGKPEPPPVPPALPGFHRRATWRVVERTLASGERIVGRLRLWCDPRRLDNDAEEWVEALLPEMTSSILGVILDLEARQDPLTGLPDRRALEERMLRAFRRSEQEGVPTAVIMCDLDRFKRINDKYGHACGDEALIAVAGLLEKHQRDDDLCCRYGGEEFALVLEKTDGEAALAVAERLRLAVERFVFRHGGKAIPLTVSAGVASYPGLTVRDSLELLELADLALYESKRQGRNRCLLNLGRGSFQDVHGEIHGPEEPPPDIEAPTLFA
jgi:diguanylate cyclase (GGDEF)-like protein